LWTPFPIGPVNVNKRFPPPGDRILYNPPLIFSFGTRTPLSLPIATPSSPAKFEAVPHPQWFFFPFFFLLTPLPTPPRASLSSSLSSLPLSNIKLSKDLKVPPGFFLNPFFYYSVLLQMKPPPLTVISVSPLFKLCKF